MFVNFFTLALQGLLRRKRSSILIFLVLFLSFSCAITTLSLTGSIRDTNAEYRLNTYGEWYIAVTDGREEDGAWLEEQSWAQTVSHTQVYGRMNGSSRSAGCFGTVDQTYLDMGRARLIAGRLPEKPGEIAVEERVLREQGFTAYELGQTIDLMVHVPAGNRAPGHEEETVVLDALVGTLCGVFHDYSNLWPIGNDAICVMVTEDTAQALHQHTEVLVQDRYPGYYLPDFEPTDQYFVQVNREDRIQAVKELRKHPFYSREGELQQADINYAAYPSGQDVVSSEEFYAYMVAAVALIAVLSVYIMQFPAQVHSFAILRSIGITLRQLLMLAFMESLLLALPAIALGIPLGALMTGVALRLLVYSGSISIQVTVPFHMLRKLFLLWLGIILLCRLIVFCATVRTPLTGRMQMLVENVRRTKRLRTALIALMLAIFGVAATYAVSESLAPIYLQEWNRRVPNYKIEVTGKEPLSLDMARTIGQIPGISQVEGFLKGTSMKEGRSATLGLSYEGLEEKTVYYYMLDENCWEDTLDLGEDREAFHNGEIVLLCFGGSAQEYYELKYGPVEEIFPTPGEKVLLRAYNDRDKVVAEDRVEVRVRRLAENTMSRSYGIFVPYTVIFSQAYLEKFLSNLTPGAQWGVYTAGGAFGYDSILVTADLNARDLSTDLVLTEFCENNQLELINKREELQAELQSYRQELIMLLACGGCVAAVALLLLGGALSMETEEECRSFRILRTIGMSKRQIRGRVLGKALARSVLAVAVGWIITFGFGIWKDSRSLKPTLSEAAEYYFHYHAYYGLDWKAGALLSVALVLLLMTVSLFVKRRLWRTRSVSVFNKNVQQKEASQ